MVIVEIQTLQMVNNIVKFSYKDMDGWKTKPLMVEMQVEDVCRPKNERFGV